MWILDRPTASLSASIWADAKAWMAILLNLDILTYASFCGLTGSTTTITQETQNQLTFVRESAHTLQTTDVPDLDRRVLGPGH